MLRGILICTVLHLFVAEVLASVDCASESAKRYGPRDVEIRLRDGSRIRGEITGIEMLTVHTEYGDLKVPVSDLRRLARGDRLTAEEIRGIEVVLKELDSDEYEKRQVAQRNLEAFGMRVFDLLTQALSNASAERRTRLQSMLKKILEKGGRRPPVQDVVRTQRADIRGYLEVQKFPVKTRFGTLEVVFDELDSIRWLAYGELREETVEALAGSLDWIDTGMQAFEGEEVSMRASGQISISGIQATPAGTSNNWGNTQPHLVGTLLAKIGSDGKPFVVGEGVKTVASANERIYLKIFVLPNMINRNQSGNYSGGYKVTLATGVQVEGLERMAPE